jgi:hypothetical protein
MSIEQNYNIRFIASLALREKQIQQNYRPIIAVHKWFARRPGTLFRGLLLSEFGKASVENSYYESNRFEGITVADPFMGGGTPLLEANRVGCNVTGLDINPMAAWVVREEIDAIDLKTYKKSAAHLLDAMARDIGHLYKTRCPITGRPDVDVKYFLWVKTGRCAGCRKPYDLFPGYVLAEDARHPSYVLICSRCGDLNEVDDPDKPDQCRCGTKLRTDGRVSRNRCECPHCGFANRGPFHGDGVPTHRLFAIEYYNPDLKDRPGRLFKKPDKDDLARFEAAEVAWRHAKPRFVPDDPIPEGDESSRLRRWGYRRFADLFNSRQLLGLETSARLISRLKDDRIRSALATNFSDLLRYQNMLCRYDTMALKSLDVFSIHGFPVGYVQVESNLLGIRNGNALPVGSGGWINIVEKYAKAKLYCAEPFEVAFAGKKKITVPIAGEWIGEKNPALPLAPARRIDIRCESATAAEFRPASLDGVFTDPPYFGMVQYGELMHFCYVWLRKLMGRDFVGLEQATTRNEEELTGNQTADRDLAHFAEGLAEAYARAAQALKLGAPLVFTYHHNRQEAYLAAGMAILDAGLICSASLPCPAEMGGSIHIHGTGSSIVDTVFVCRKRGEMRRDWLFRDADGLARIMSDEMSELRAAGMKPTAGDMRCMAMGHITRMAVWQLRSTWKTSRPTDEKLSMIRNAMDAIASADDLAGRIHDRTTISLDFSGSLFERRREEAMIDAIAF